MNRIVEVNAELAYAVIQPGVTQGQLCDYLRNHDIPCGVDCTGAGYDASVVGNTLERGFGHTPYADHVLNICGMRVVLPDGRILDTGLSHYANAQARRAYAHGVGPSLDGLFAQSNFGIVTEMGVWLMPRPESFCAFFVRGELDKDLESILEPLVRLRRGGLLQSAIHIANDLRVISGRMTYPWHRAEQCTPLPSSLRSELRKEMGVGAWNVAGGIYGNARTVAAVKRTLRNALRPHRVKFLDDRILNAARSVAGVLSRVGLGRRWSRLVESITPIYGLMKGEPTDEPLRGAAWRVRGVGAGEPLDPRDVHAGLIWVSPLLPATPRAAREVVAIMEPIYFKHGFELLITFSMINARAMVGVSNVAFDTREKEESARAEACYTELDQSLIAAGYLSYRTGPQGYGKLVGTSSVFWQVVQQIKGTLDPQGIMSPGRYIPSSSTVPGDKCGEYGGDS